MRLAYLSVCVFVALGSADRLQAQQPDKGSPDVAAIRDTARAFVSAYDAGDAAAIAALWTPQGEYVLGQTVLTGRPAIQKAYEEFFKAHPGTKMEVEIDSIKVLAPDVAVEEGRASVWGSPNGVPSASDYLAIHVKQGGKWQMASVRESRVPAAPPSGELEGLAWLVGEWSATSEDATVDVKYDWAADKHFIRGETTVKAKDAQAAPGGLQIIGKDPFTGRLITWFFHGDGGRGYGVWAKDGGRWVILTEGATFEGVPTTATNVLYQPHENVMSWQSVNRTFGGQMLPDTKEVVMERVTSK